MAVLLSALTATAQKGVHWLFTSAEPAHRTYELAFEVAHPKATWVFQTKRWQSTAVWESTSEGVRLTQRAGRIDSLPWQLHFANGQLHRAKHGARAYLPVAGTAGLLMDTALVQQQPADAAARRVFQEALPPGYPLPEARAILLRSRDENRQYLGLVDQQGWPLTWVCLEQGKLSAWLDFDYQWGEGGRLRRRLARNKLSGAATLTEYCPLRPGSTGPEGWMAVQGGAAFWLFSGHGEARFWAGEGAKLLPGQWSRQGNTLKVTLAGQRAPLVYDVEEKAWGWAVRSGDTLLQDWVWLEQLRPEEPRQLERWRAEAAAAHLQPFRVNGRAGLRHPSGQIRIAPQYDGVRCPHPQLAIVELEERFGLMGINGASLLPIYFEKLEYWGDSLLLAQREGAQGVLHLSGDTIVPFKYERLAMRDDTSYWAFRSGKMGLLNAAGHTLLECRFDSIHPFIGGQAIASVDGQTGLIGEKGHWVVAPGTFAKIIPQGLKGYLVESPDGQWGTISRAGAAVHPAVYGHLRALSDGVLAAQQNGRFGLLSADGQTLVPIQYRALKGCPDYTATAALCSSLEAHRAIAQFVGDGRFGYLDALGREHPPMLPAPEVIEADYEQSQAPHQLVFTYPDNWAYEASIQRLYKKRDYGQSRVQYAFLPSGGRSLATWLAEEVEHDLDPATVGGRPAFAYTEEERVRYYDIYKKHMYCLVPDGSQVLHLEFSCKAANFLESIQDLFEIERLLRFEE